MMKSDLNRLHSPHSAGINTQIYGKTVALDGPWPAAMCEERSVILDRLHLLPDTRESGEIHDFIRDLEQRGKKTTTHTKKNRIPALFREHKQLQPWRDCGGTADGAGAINQSEMEQLQAGTSRSPAFSIRSNR